MAMTAEQKIEKRKQKQEQKAGEAVTEVIQAAKNAGLRIKNEAVDWSNPDIFQMDVQNRNEPRRQVFRIHRGQASVHLVDSSRLHHQVVLQVQEPPNWAYLAVENKKGLTIEQIGQTYPGDGRDFVYHGDNETGARRGDKHTYFRTKEAKNEPYKSQQDLVPKWYQMAKQTPGNKRWFLFGYDEKHYFIAQLPKKAANVKQAHDLLTPPRILKMTAAERKQVLRQGEFFFVPTDADTVLEYVTQQSYSNHAGNECSTLDSHFSKDSTSDHVIHGEAVCGSNHGTQDEDEDGRMFLKGTVTHDRHATIDTKGRWYEVLINREVNDADGIGFVD